MEEIKVLIVEDKLLVAEDIALRLEKHGLKVIAICPSGEEAIEMVKSEVPDLILMDIELAGAMDGISTAQTILQQHTVPIIYLSDFADQKTLDRAKKTHPANYLTKPFNEPDLIRAVDLAFSNASAKHSTPNSSTQKTIFVRTDSQVLVKLMIDDILYLQANRAYCTIVTAEKNYTLSSSMNHIFDQLQGLQFLRVHRSFVVNVSRVNAVNGNTILVGNKEVIMSREHRDELLSRLNILK